MMRFSLRRIVGSEAAISFMVHPTLQMSRDTSEWRRHLSHILSWDTRPPKAHPFGNPSDIDFKLRNTLWPDGSSPFDDDSNMIEGNYVCPNEEHPPHIQEPVYGLRNASIPRAHAHIYTTFLCTIQNWWFICKQIKSYKEIHNRFF